MDHSYLDVIADLIDGRNSFITTTINRLPHSSRDNLMNRFFLTEQLYLEFLNRIHQHQMRTQTAAALMTLNIPINFSDSVIVTPTSAQIQSATERVATPPADTSCAICQEGVLANGTRIRHCGHTYHHDCISSWFTMSVRCPVCRHDIRDTLPSSQSSVTTED